jgi:hypothetical protein
LKKDHRYDAFVKAGDDWRAIFDPQIIAKW